MITVMLFWFPIFHALSFLPLVLGQDYEVADQNLLFYIMSFQINILKVSGRHLPDLSSVFYSSFLNIQFHSNWFKRSYY